MQGEWGLLCAAHMVYHRPVFRAASGFPAHPGIDLSVFDTNLDAEGLKPCCLMPARSIHQKTDQSAANKWSPTADARAFSA